MLRQRGKERKPNNCFLDLVRSEKPCMVDLQIPSNLRDIFYSAPILASPIIDDDAYMEFSSLSIPSPKSSSIELPDLLTNLETFQQKLLNYRKTDEESTKFIIKYISEHPVLGASEFNICVSIRPNLYLDYAYLYSKLIEEFKFTFRSLLFVPKEFSKILIKENYENSVNAMQISNYSNSFCRNPYPHLGVYKLPFLISKNYSQVDVLGFIKVPLTTEVIISFIKDDLDYFLKLSTQQSEFTNFGFYFEERPGDLYSFINVAAYYGSVNIFKYCISSQTNFIILPQFVIAGGSKEILRICEQQGIKLVDYAVIALLYRRDDIYEWLIEQSEVNRPNPLYYCTETYSIKKFYEFCQLNKKALNNSYFIPFLIENMKEEIKLFAEHIIPTYDNVFLTKDIETHTNLFKDVKKSKIISLFESFMYNDDEFHMNLIYDTHLFDYFSLSKDTIYNLRFKFPNMYNKILSGVEKSFEDKADGQEITDYFKDPSKINVCLEILARKKDLELFVKTFIKFKESVSIETALDSIKTFDLIWTSVFYYFSDKIIESDQYISIMATHINLEKMSYLESTFQNVVNQRFVRKDFEHYNKNLKTFVQKSLAFIDKLEPIRICYMLILAIKFAPECIKKFNIFEIPVCENLDDYIYQIVNNKKFFSPILENIENCKSLIAADARFIMGMSKYASNKEFVDYVIHEIGDTEHKFYINKFLMNPEVKKHYSVEELVTNVSKEHNLLLNNIELTKEEFDYVNSKSEYELFNNPKNAIYYPLDKILKHAMTTGIYDCLEHFELTKNDLVTILSQCQTKNSFPLIRNESFKKLCDTDFIINMMNSNTRAINTEDAILAMYELITHRKAEFQENKIISWFKYIIKCDKLTEFLKNSEGILDKSTLFEISHRYHHPFVLNGVTLDLDHIEKFDSKTIKSIYENVNVPHDYHMKYLLQILKHEDTPDVIDLILSQSKMNIDVFVDKTPLQYAVKYNHPQTVLYLLNKGANTGYIGNRTILTFTKDEEMKKILLPYVDMDNHQKYLISLSKTNDVDFTNKCKKFVKDNAKVIDKLQKNFEFKEFMEYLFTWDVSLEEAFSYLSSMVTQDKLIKSCGFDSLKCATSQFFASVSNDIVANAKIEFQLCYGVLRRRTQFITPDPRLGNLLYVSVVCGNEEVVSKILECGVDPNEYEGYKHLTNPGLECVRSGKLNLLKLLVSHGLDINRVYYHDNTTLINASILNHQKKCFNYLLELHCDLSHKVILSPYMAAMSISKTNNYYEKKLLPLIDMFQETFVNQKASKIHKF
ncbi:hypothetical protein TVAG_379660 [Trichomonas vaginalis G3]|uniref:DUF3447 domain-containing protein n=1 Tax=Trichomonas vaginalis (strain ATCC PRA-98 / G3) TaxID=412133 RepID=A2E7J1_TRIV3|nr:ankyrin repeat and EF-Hand domain-containing protein 1 family [Trichomonas vaginalis G3]EAY11384.1 hypothetical protein TVAG_379660 [Trichomonas vaginalis G3]KAI5530549.1 ankyrin repeat and EF-Hand domain-containing protein 1 family [Trichomonas vaginalis G3]|eukprot:XP_001323607.1 hypothetical protein [Trichomonas vaginalis G3]